MKRTLLSLLTIACCALAFAQSAPPWSVAGHYSIARKETSAVALTDLGTVRDVFGKRGLDLSARGFLGLNLDRQFEPVAGFAVGPKLSVARGSDFFAAIAFDGQLRRRVAVGVVLGLTVRLEPPNGPVTRTVISSL